MEINHLLVRLNGIDEMLRNRTYTSIKYIGDCPIKYTEQKYSSETIQNISEEKSSIIKRLFNEGLISDEEMTKYYLSEDWGFTPKINYDKITLSK